MMLLIVSREGLRGRALSRTSGSTLVFGWSAWQALVLSRCGQKPLDWVGHFQEEAWAGKRSGHSEVLIAVAVIEYLA